MTAKLKQTLLSNDVPKDNIHYTCIACITIDSVMKTDKKTIGKFIQKSVNIKQRKYKCQDLITLINSLIGSDLDSESDAKLMAKLKSDSDNDSE